MYRMRKILAIIISMALILALFSCKEEGEVDFLRSIDSPAAMTVTGERYGIAFSAEVELSVGEGRMRFTSPASMAGIEVVTAGGVWNSSFDGIGVAGISAERLGAPLFPLTEIGAAISAEKITEDGIALTLIVTENGNRFEYYIDSKSGFPLRIIEKNAADEVVMAFEISDYIIK